MWLVEGLGGVSPHLRRVRVIALQLASEVHRTRKVLFGIGFSAAGLIDHSQEEEVGWLEPFVEVYGFVQDGESFVPEFIADQSQAQGVVLVAGILAGELHRLAGKV